MTHTIRRKIEREIADAFLTEALAAGFAINVDNGGDTEELPNPVVDRGVLLGTMFATDEDRLNLYTTNLVGGTARWRKVGQVVFVYGNSGWDVISDYSPRLKHVMTKAEELSEHYSR